MPQVGDILDGYRLLRPIGRGGFGEVWLCQVETTGEFKALKFLPASNLSQLEREQAALIRYRKITADLHCPNLVSIEHVNKTGEGLFYIMPLADGLPESDGADSACRRESGQPLTLAVLIALRMTASTWFTAEEVRQILLPLMDAVQLLNDAGVVHRDIKPENILFFRGRPCLGDIGLLTADTAQITRRGTPGYAAPSWYLESGANPDMWGLATTLYTLITGNNPDKIGRGAFLYPPQGEASVEMAAWDQFHHAIFRATSGDAPERFLRLEDFAQALAVASPPFSNALKPSPPILLKWLTPWISAALLLCATALFIAGWWLFRLPHQQPPAAVASTQKANIEKCLSPTPEPKSRPKSTPVDLFQESVESARKDIDIINRKGIDNSR